MVHANKINGKSSPIHIYDPIYSTSISKNQLLKIWERSTPSKAEPLNVELIMGTTKGKEITLQFDESWYNPDIITIIAYGILNQCKQQKPIPFKHITVEDFGELTLSKEYKNDKNSK